MTFCVPNRNKIAFIAECFDSILRQDSDSWACVVVDGLSTDGSREFLEPFKYDSRFTILDGLGQGMYTDWSYCLKFVKTDYFYFLPSDDICDSRLVSRVVSILDRCQLADVCHFAFDEIDAQGKIITSYQDLLEKHAEIYVGPHQFAHLRSGLFDYLMHLVFPVVFHTMNSLVYRRCLIERLEGFDLEFDEAADIDWQIRSVIGTNIVFLPDRLACIRRYPEQSTNMTPALKALSNNLKVRLAALERLSYVLGSAPVESPKRISVEDTLKAWILGKYRQTLWSESFKRMRHLKFDCETFDLISAAHRESDAAACEYLWERIFLHNRKRTSLARMIIEQLNLCWPPAGLTLQ